MLNKERYILPGKSDMPDTSAWGGVRLQIHDTHMGAGGCFCQVSLCFSCLKASLSAAAEVDRTIKPVTELSKIRLSLDFITGQWLPRPPPVKVVRKSRPQLSQAQVRLYLSSNVP